jgi:UDP-N-acetylmuramyl pentapeptide phosphotransferase/UDP-N-acetylglucosamine-1-phosphate transferase
MQMIVKYLLFASISTILTGFFRYLAKDTNLMDKPNQRSLHTIPTVRGAGIVFISLFLVSILLEQYLTASYSREICGLFIGTMLLAAIGFYDDLYSLSAAQRFYIQFLAAGLALFSIHPDFIDLFFFFLSNKYLIGAFLLFMILWAINHFNFMDGMDGFCALQAIFLFSSYALFLGFEGDYLYQALCLNMVCGLLGFLFFNFPPAKLFMGDVGSATLGYISFFIALVAEQKYHIPLFYWIILNSLFLFDSTFTLVRRVIHKERWSAPHRKHAYQRLKLLGLNTRLILLGQFAVNCIFLSGLLLAHFHQLSLIYFMTFLLGSLFVIYGVIEKLNPMFKEHEVMPHLF